MSSLSTPLSLPKPEGSSELEETRKKTVSEMNKTKEKTDNREITNNQQGSVVINIDSADSNPQTANATTTKEQTDRNTNRNSSKNTGTSQEKSEKRSDAQSKSKTNPQKRKLNENEYFTPAAEIDFTTDLSNVMIPGCRRCYDGARRDHVVLCPKSPNFDQIELQLCVRGFKLDCPRCLDEYLRGSTSINLHALDCPRHKSKKNEEKKKLLLGKATTPAKRKRDNTIQSKLKRTKLLDLTDLKNLVLPCCPACVSGRSNGHLDRICPKADDFNISILEKLAKGLEVKCQSCLVEFYKKYNKNIPHSHECSRSMKRLSSSSRASQPKRRSHTDLITEHSPAFCLCLEKEFPSELKRHSRMCQHNEDFDAEYRDCVVLCANSGCDRCDVEYKMGISKAKNGGSFRRDDCLYWNYLKPNELLRSVSEHLALPPPERVLEMNSKKQHSSSNNKLDKKKSVDSNSDVATDMLLDHESTSNSTKSRRAKSPKDEEIHHTKEAPKLSDYLQNKQTFTLEDLKDSSLFCHKCKTKIGNSHHILCQLNPKYDGERLKLLMDGTNKGCMKCKMNMLQPKSKSHGHNHIPNCPFYKESKDEEEQIVIENDSSSDRIESSAGNQSTNEALQQQNNEKRGEAPEMKKGSSEDKNVPMVGSSNKEESMNTKEKKNRKDDSGEKAHSENAPTMEKPLAVDVSTTTPVIDGASQKEPPSNPVKSVNEKTSDGQSASSSTLQREMINHDSIQQNPPEKTAQSVAVASNETSQVVVANSVSETTSKAVPPSTSASSPDTAELTKPSVHVEIDKSPQNSKAISNQSAPKRFNPFPLEGSKYEDTHSSSDLNVLILSRNLPPKGPWGFGFHHNEPGGACLVTAVQPKSPASLGHFLGSKTPSSLRTRDMILSINGSSVGGLTKDEVAAICNSAASELQLVLSRYKLSTGQAPSRAAVEKKQATTATPRTVTSVDESIQEEKKESNESMERLLCVCGQKHEDNSSFWMQCDTCECWHLVFSSCVGFTEDEALGMEKYECWDCSGMNTRQEPPTLHSKKPTREFFVGDVVKVNDQAVSTGGVGRIVDKRVTEDGKRTYDVRYVLGGRATALTEDVLESHNFESRRLS